MEEKRFNRLLERYKYSPEAVKELYEYYYPIIVRYINRQFRGEVDGQDVAQQFFLKLFQMKSYKIRTPNAWVRTVTKNIAIDILRKNGKQYRVKELLVLPDYTGPPDNVADILKVLSESEQQIMYLRYWEKYNLKEIAELIKMKYSSVKYIHRAAKKKLRKAYIKELDYDKENEFIDRLGDSGDNDVADDEPAYIDKSGGTIIYQLTMIDRNKIQKDCEMIQKIWERDKERYKLSKESWELVSMKCHDLKHQLDALKNVNGIIDENVLGELKTNLNLYGAGVKTGNHALDIILFEKTIICQKNNIKLNCMAEAEKLGFMSSSNLYSLFGNALQNAIEATMKIKDEDKRLICLNIKNVSNMISVHIENSMAEGESLSIVKDFPVTTKEDKINHGYGMRSIQMIVEKFDGAVNFYVQDGWFNLDIIIPVKEAN